MFVLNSIKQRGLNALASLRTYSLSQPTNSTSTVAVASSVVNDNMSINPVEKVTHHQPSVAISKSHDKEILLSNVKDDDMVVRLNSLFKECPQKDHLNQLMILYHTEYNMSVWSYDSHSEREEMVKTFTQFSLSVSDKIKKAGYWCDFIDPTSGMPYHGSYSNETLTECDEDFHRLSDYLSLEDIGCCRALKHCNWDFNIFAGLLVTDAPAEILMDAYKSTNHV